MDTKLKNNKIVGTLLIWILLIIMSISVVFGYSKFYDRAQKQSENPFETYQFQTMLEKRVYALYYNVQQMEKKETLNPSDIFLEKIEETEYVNDIITSWKDELEYQSQNLNYYVYDKDEIILESDERTFKEVKMFNEKECNFYLDFTLDKEGNAVINKVYGANQEVMESMLGNVKTFLGEYIEGTTPPKSISVIFSVPKTMEEYGEVFTLVRNIDSTALLFSGFGVYVALLSAIVVLFGLLAPLIKPLGIGTGITSKIPLEAVGVGAFGFVFYITAMGYGVYYSITGKMEGYLSKMGFGSYSSMAVDFANIGAWVIFFGIILILVLAIRQIFVLGIRTYCTNNILAIRCIVWIKRKIQFYYHKALEFDLQDKTNRSIFKLVLLNLVLLVILCSFWLFGIVGLLIYSVVLFYLIREKVMEIQKQHEIVLKATKNMAEGNLDFKIKEDVGVFEPLKQQLERVQSGFKKAVEEEVKSQNMKYELITNVSHDLKTPLTAIITYVNLLKEEHITEEEKQSYIQTLEKKSLRLKQLIEDLFEVSKATSNNLEVHLEVIDVIALIKQVECEVEEKLKEANIEFRLRTNEEKILIALDSQKSYRIFENLFINIAKYGMPHTRAYIEITQSEKEILIVVKNISLDELTFNVEQITERFVRGDISRNTDGSGLGLAIVKSFVELQGGKFYIEVDGDMFKANIVFLREKEIE